VARSKPAGDAWSVAAPRLSADPAPAPVEVVDADEWIGVVATVDYVGQRANGLELSDVAVSGGRWSGVTLQTLRANDVFFTNCDLSGFVLEDDASLRRVSFSDCRLSGAVFAGAQLHDVSFTDCALDEGNFRMARLGRVSFDGCSLVAADFYGAVMEGVRMRRCDLRGVTLSKATLSSVDLRSCALEDVIGADALRGATIDSAQVLSVARSLAVALGVVVVDD
jgi:uncharacterized protein YjbI with pentapeptide repeats